MSVFKKLFPGKKPKKEDAIAELRASINKLELRQKVFAKRAADSHKRARQYLRAGNKKAAKQYLARWSKFQKMANRYTAFTNRLEDRIIALEEAADIKTLTAAMELASKELQAARKIVSSERALEISLETEESIAEIERVGDIFETAIGGDELEDLDVERELNRLEMEDQLEAAGMIPEVPDTEPVATKKKQLKDQIEELKRSLEE
ncbi:MAG: Snf7 family protein [Candidatus Helarchaeota archaeon]